MKNSNSKKTDLKELSIWLISTYVIAFILIFLTTEYLRDGLSDSLFENIRIFLALVIFGVVIMSLINSIKFLRKTDFKKNFKWFILGAFPFIIFVIGFIASFNWKNLFLSIFD